MHREFSYESPGEKFLKSVYICQSYYQTSRGLVFLEHGVYIHYTASILLANSFLAGVTV